MAQFNLGNLCGTNANFNKLEVQFEDLKKKLLDDIEADASALVSNLTGGLVQLDLNLRNLLSEKPILPNVNLQFFKSEVVFEDCVPCTGVKNKLRHYLKTADFIMIDNNPISTTRTKFAKFIDEHKTPESIIILDNGEKHMEAMTFLKSKYYCLDFPGKRYDGSFSVTSIFFTNHNYNRVI